MPHWPTVYMTDDEYDHVEEQVDGEDEETFNGYVRQLIRNDMEAEA